MSLLACGGMLACTNEDVTGENDGKEGTTSYMAVNIMTASGPGSRALPDGYESGSKEENEISTMRFYLFDSEGNPYTLTGGGGGRIALQLLIQKMRVMIRPHQR